MGVMYYSHVDIVKVQRMTDQRGNQQNEPVVANFYSGIQSHYDSGATLWNVAIPLHIRRDIWLGGSDTRL